MAIIENLQIGQGYTKKELAELINEPKAANYQTGLLYCDNRDTTILFVTLHKNTKELQLHYNDYFVEDYFEWDSQNSQDFENKRIQNIYKREVDVHLMARVSSKLKGKTQSFIYCGELEYYSHIESSSKPVHITFSSLDYQFENQNDNLKELYRWKPNNENRITSSIVNRKRAISPRRKATYKKPDFTERKGLVSSRVGQGYYREQILEKWNYKCAVTNANVPSILIASHIVPWKDASDEERLDPENGILLSPNYDALFDRHLISFSDHGEILVSNTINKEDLNKLGIDFTARIMVNDEMKPYLEKHRSLLK